MKTRYTKLVESIHDEELCRAYYFKFRDSYDNTQAYVMWYVSKREEMPYQSMTIEIEGGDDDQIRELISAYLEARVSGERFDIGDVHFIFEQYALNEGFDIEVE